MKLENPEDRLCPICGVREWTIHIKWPHEIKACQECAKMFS